ncbi:MAG TPA: hypothetical protein VNV42_15075 [Solirubrobacteraceae bacterium]|nr:hypothetical protein [Solirubrobacteraceae bacterium]
MLLTLGATVAHAELNLSTTFGAQGTGDGQFAAPSGIGVDQTTLDPTSGDVYVADTDNARVEQFDAAGTFLAAWGWGVADGKSELEVCASGCRAGLPGSGAGQLAAPTSIAVDSASGPNQGDVYVGDSANRVIDEFSPSGALLGTITGPSAGNTFQAVTSVATDGEGNLWVLDGGANVVYEFSGGGALISQFNDTYGETHGIAADSAGDVYLIRGTGQTEKWTAAARAGGAPVEVDSNQSSGLGVDQASNDLYVDLGSSIDEWGPAAESLGNFGSGTLGQGGQMAYNPSAMLAGAGAHGALYVVDEADSRVAVFVPPAPAPPAVLPGSETATGVTSTAATLEATINANGLDTKYFFEYGPTAAYGTQIPLAPGTDIGSNYAFSNVQVALAGVAASTTYHFRVVAVNSLGTTDGPDATFTTATPSAPAVESEADANVTSAAAVLQASVNPEFSDTHYYFEYGPTTAYGSTLPAPPGTDIGESDAAQSAEVAISGLSASTTYHFRVVAVNSLGTTDGPDTTLTTAPPVNIEAEAAANVTATAADLTAKIGTEDLATGYQFEYGTTPAYGLRAPLPEATLAAATSTQKVTVRVENLQPNTTYYFRLAATNALGTVTASAAQFTTYPPGEAFSLPDNRVYEMVSPPDKNGGDVGGGGAFLTPSPNAFGQSSESGSAITYASSTSFGDARGAALTTQYLSTRGPSGWTTHALSPPVAGVEHFEFAGLAPFHLFTPELTAWVFSWKHPSLTRGAPPEVENLYRGEGGSNAYQLIDDGTPANAGAESYGVTAIGASSDLSHVVFEAHEALTPGAPSGAWSVYEWTLGAPLRLVSVLPGPGEVAAASASGPGGEANPLPNSMSADGSRIFWIDGNNQLYVREDATTTVKLNASQRTPSLGEGTARFMAATPDGSKAFFIDETALTNALEDNGGLYEYSVADGRLTDLTPDAGGDPGVEGVLGIGEGGASVYFVASASLTSNGRPGAGQPSPGGENLYLARGGAITFIATLSSADSDDWTDNFEERTARVTGDGGYLAFVSQTPLTGYDNTDLNTGEADAEVFLYDAGADELRCASCNPSGEQPIGPASVPTARDTGRLPRYLSEDGQRLFFDSKDALLPAASNGKQNVYEYENGAIHLISSGTSDEDSTLADASANGDDVFFTTRSPLVPEDQDEHSDMYDARVDGGFPAANSPAECSGEGCRGPVSAPPAPATIATEEAQSAEALPAPPADPAPAGGQKAKKPKNPKKSTHKRSAHKRSARHSARKAKSSRGSHGGRRDGRGRRAVRHSLKVNHPAAAREGGSR